MSRFDKLVAFCPRLAGRNIVINETLFVFDKAGYCRVDNKGNISLDFNTLCGINGVKRISEQAKSDVQVKPQEPSHDRVKTQKKQKEDI